MKIRTIALAMALAFGSLSMFAGIPENIKALHKSGEKVTSSFVETKAMPKLKKEEKKEGNLTFTAPEELLLEYTNPAGDYTKLAKDLFEVSRNGVVNKFPVKNADSRMAVLRYTLLMAMAGDVEAVAAKNGATTEYQEANGEYVCTLTSEKGKHGIQKLTLVYNQKTGKLVSLTLTEKNGNYTTYSVK